MRPKVAISVRPVIGVESCPHEKVNFVQIRNVSFHEVRVH